ncbi:MAG: hypothetical protein KGL53_00805 [Elusimicrobia bacterium]|nr:hypothetical protein [Elusimicrobiota bacterium]
MGAFFKGVYGLGGGEEPEGPAARAADVRDNVADQLVTMAWACLLTAVVWGMGRAAPGPWPATAMAAVAFGWAGWRLRRLVPRYRRALEAQSLPRQ